MDWRIFEDERVYRAIAQGKRPAVAAALNLIDDRRPESRRDVEKLFAALDAYENPRRSHVVGVTGPPGTGKSSLASALAECWLGEGLRVGILAIDPSSPFSGGALLGDRLRMTRSDPDERLFIRSLSSRGEKGGLTPNAWLMSRVLLSGFDRVVIETVGVGQSEIDIAHVADSTCLVIQPGSGDTIQFLKAGIMEIPDILAVNKADLGQMARTTAEELRLALPEIRDENAWKIPVETVSAAHHTGIERLAAAVQAHFEWLDTGNRLEDRRRQAEARWGVKRLRERFGEYGLEKGGGEDGMRERWMAASGSPFEKLKRFGETIEQSLK